MQELIRKLSETYGPSGEESQVRELIFKEIEHHADQISTDTMGNLIAVKYASSPQSGKKNKLAISRKTGASRGNPGKIMFAAHMDEIGLVITHIDEKGFLRIAPVGGISPVQLVGQRFMLADGTAGTVYHEKLKDIKELDWPKIYMDIGAQSKEEALRKTAIGNMAVYNRQFNTSGSCYMGKAMDDRIGCAVLVQTLKSLTQESVNDLYFVFTVQEEVGLRGARGAAYSIEPDFAVAVDVTRSGDTPEAPLMEVALGKGPAVKVMDSSMISHPGVRRLMTDIAEAGGLPYQLEVLERGGTDAGAIHLSRSGVPSGVLSIPCRYVHTASEMVHRDDTDNAVKLLIDICKVKDWSRDIITVG